MITYTNRSVFDIGAEAIVNPVNCVGVSGAGLAREFARRYPQNDRLYKQACKDGRIKPGRGLITTDDGRKPRHIVNFPTKRHWRDQSRLSDIKLGLRNLHRQLLPQKISSIAIPAIGAGLGGLNWDEVRKLLEKEFGTETDIAVTICNPRETR